MTHLSATLYSDPNIPENVAQSVMGSVSDIFKTYNLDIIDHENLINNNKDKLPSFDMKKIE